MHVVYESLVDWRDVTMALHCESERIESEGVRLKQSIETTIIHRNYIGIPTRVVSTSWRPSSEAAFITSHRDLEREHELRVKSMFSRRSHIRESRIRCVILADRSSILNSYLCHIGSPKQPGHSCASKTEESSKNSATCSYNPAHELGWTATRFKDFVENAIPRAAGVKLSGRRWDV